jgi:hypothetical protein
VKRLMAMDRGRMFQGSSWKEKGEKRRSMDYEILYIMGTGRSGTTILEIMLSNAPGFLGVGELTHLSRDGYKLNHPCACSERLAGWPCAFWKDVLNKTGRQREEMDRMIRRSRSVEAHRSFPVTLLGINRQRRWEEYAEINRVLFSAIHEVSGRRVIIDSSKYAGRAMALSRIFKGRVKILCMTRSPQGLFQAFRKQNEVEQKSKGALTTLIYYVYVLLCCRLVAMRKETDVLRITYEDLMDHPQEVFRRIESWSGWDLREVRSRLLENRDFTVGHIVTGNRVRKLGRILFRPVREEQEFKGVYARSVLRTMEYARNWLGFT